MQYKLYSEEFLAALGALRPRAAAPATATPAAPLPPPLPPATT